MKKLITISGPRGAGKDTVQTHLVEHFGSRLHRALFITTRPRREYEQEGREYLRFVEDHEFNRIARYGGFVYQNAPFWPHRAGLTAGELAFPANILNVVPEGARFMRKYMADHGGDTLLVAIAASRSECRARIKLRQPILNDAEIDAMTVSDPAALDQETYHDFDLVLENRDGELEAVLAEITVAARNFLR